MSCNFRSVSRQPFKLCYFIYNFFFRLFGLVREAANTLKEDFRAARKFKDYRFQDICLASGQNGPLMVMGPGTSSKPMRRKLRLL